MSSNMAVDDIPITLFSFPSFNPESCTNGDLLCMGSVTVGNSTNGHYLNLTPEPPNGSSTSPAATNEIGRVLYGHPVLAWPAMISTTFTVRISAFPNSSSSGDGMTFLIAQDNSPSPPGSFGSYLGLLDRSTQGGMFRQLAVELDTFMNEFDIDGNHIGIVTTSIINPVVEKSLNSTGIQLNSGRDIKVKIDYDGLNNMLSVSLGYSENPLVSFLNRSISMSDIVPRSVYVGFTASTGTLPETHQVLNWVFTSVPLSLETGSKTEEQLKIILVVAIPLSISLSIVFSFIYLLVLKRFKGNKSKKQEDIESRSRTAANVPMMFTYKELWKATNGFSKENLLGTGGFGSVYKGTIHDDDLPPKAIAVKKISSTSEQGEREYLAEICTTGRLRHKNILKLEGWCHQSDHLLLVYDYMPNGSLDRFIGKRLSLDWETRYKVLTGLASALLYLHEECGPTPVVHRDVKPNNIMLDSHFTSHLGDFGLARLLFQNDNASAVVSTTMMAGTPGYLAPELGFTGKATPESDVYSFGMVVLELVCGRRTRGMVGESSLVDLVWGLVGKNELLRAVDPLLDGRFEEEEVKRLLVVGLACLHPDYGFRPKMRKVVQVLLNPNEPLMDLPETRPNMVCVSVAHVSSSSSSSTTMVDFGPKSGSAMADEIAMHYG
ncbi:Serine/threonine protein kinase [Trema orientale]|uniref:non-specific serine/threonine protein kinase n=1 Tax=Trema orientale TaxID=63057 RepID=A0A2P5DUJ8_TREOI|nr:Serine/threonine protein kinase [Trema orientale]